MRVRAWFTYTKGPRRKPGSGVPPAGWPIGLRACLQGHAAVARSAYQLDVVDARLGLVPVEANRLAVAAAAGLRVVVGRGRLGLEADVHGDIAAAAVGHEAQRRARLRLEAVQHLAAGRAGKIGRAHV